MRLIYMGDNEPLDEDRTEKENMDEPQEEFIDPEAQPSHPDPEEEGENRPQPPRQDD